ncbi:MAG: glycosyltransferase [bacterium]
MKKVNLTVLITTFNCGNFIFAAINSILLQTFKDCELLIIDDGSTDDTERVVNSIKDPRIIYEKIEHVGRSTALNYGLKKSANDWVALMDADDICHPQRFEMQLKSTSFCENEILISNSAAFAGEKILYQLINPSNLNDLKKLILLHGHICNSTVIYNRNFIISNGGYSELLSNSEDYDLWLRILNKAKFINCGQILVYFRIRKDSYSRHNIKLTRQSIYQLQKPFYHNLIEYSKIFDLKEHTKYLGWSEYFYGNSALARRYWRKLSIGIIKDYRLFLAYIISNLPPVLFSHLKELRIRYRLNYFWMYLKKENRNLRNELSLLLKHE